MMSRTRSVVAGLAALSLLACSESGVDSPEDAAIDTPFGTIDASVDAVDAKTPDGAGDLGAGDDTDAGEPPADFPPCVTGDDCDSGYCIPGPEGMQCTKLCESLCPEGYACKPVGGGGDVVFLCVPMTVYLCQPCTTSAECNATAGGKDLCLSLGDQGSFCGMDCSDATGSPCPTGYACETLTEGPTAGARQCVPNDGECACNGAGRALGMATSCAVANEHGTCAGQRHCGPDGLTACDGPEAAAEVCNGQDDNCNGVTDEGVTGSPCSIEGEHGTCPGTQTCEGGQMVCTGKAATAETCNGVDDDCDGQTDEVDAIGCTAWYFDADGDDFGAAASQCQCGPGIKLPGGGFTAAKSGDCDDADPLAYPNAVEVCNGKDDDCDGKTDEAAAEGCTTFYYDGDGDGFGTEESKCLCGPDEATKFTATKKGDCNDKNAAVHPDAVETCNGFDDDCDGLTDPEASDACVKLHYDFDNDGYGVAELFKCLCAPSGKYTATGAQFDCNDSNVLINPGVLELCNGVDDDCDGQTDEGHGDVDGDGVADCVDPDIDGDGTPNGSDCAPMDPKAYPGAAEDCNGKDDDCDGQTDEENAGGCKMYFYDGDGDGYGLTADKKCLCAPVGKHNASQGGDCNDNNGSVSPGKFEACNGVDDNCDGSIDEPGASGCTTYYYDGDLDGFGDPDKSQCLCAPSVATKYNVTTNTDCYDANANARPNQTAFFTTHRGDGSFDYDCNKTPEKQYTAVGDCPNLCSGSLGWMGAVPNCGGVGTWLTKCYYDFFEDPIFCQSPTESRFQGCR